MRPARRVGLFRCALASLGLLVATLGCLTQAALQESPQVTHTPAPQAEVIPALTQSAGVSVAPEAPERSEQVVSLIERVSAQNLMADVERLATIDSRHVNSPGIAEAAVVIHDRFQAAADELLLEYDPFLLDFDGTRTTQRNVVATIAGSDPTAGIVMVGAHYDSRTIDLTDSVSRAPGANDNATGVAALIEMSRLLADTKPRATVVLVAFSAEEVGTVGSKSYVAGALERGDDIRALLVLDIVGNGAGDVGEGAIRAFSAPPEDSSARQLARFVDLQSQTYVSDLDVQLQATVDRPGRYSDHVPFSEAGFPAMRLIEPVEDLNRQHSGGDLPDAISPAYLRWATQLALASVVNLAGGPSPPSDLTWDNSDVLRWSGADDAAGYVIAFRRPDGVEVDAVVHVGEVTSLTWSGLSDGRFGSVSVAALDADGLMGALSPELVLTEG